MTAGLLTPDGRAGAWAGGTIDVELGHGENAHDSNKFTIIYNVKHDRFLQHDRFLSWYLWGPVWRVVNAVAPDVLYFRHRPLRPARGVSDRASGSLHGPDIPYGIGIIMILSISIRSPVSKITTIIVRFCTIVVNLDSNHLCVRVYHTPAGTLGIAHYRNKVRPC